MTALAIAAAFAEPFEGYVAKPYRDSGGVCTIGIGSCFNDDGSRVTMATPPITHEQAVKRLQTTLAAYQEKIKGYIHVDLNDNQWAALLDFAYNLGPATLHGSTLVAKINAKDFAGAALQFAPWCHCAGKVLPGLVKRRAAEAKLFLTPVPTA